MSQDGLLMSCSACAHKPCRDCFAGGGVFARPVIPINTQAIPSQCPAKVDRNHPRGVEGALRGMHLEDLERLSREALRHAPSAGVYAHRNSSGSHAEALQKVIAEGIRQGHLFVLFPTFGSPAEAMAKHGVSAKAAMLKTKADDKRKAQEKDEWSVETEEKEKPALINATWVWVADSSRPGCEEKGLTSAACLDGVYCKVDTRGLMPGDTVTYTVYLKGRNGDADTKIETFSGRVGEGRADMASVARYKVPQDVAGRPLQPEVDTLYFIARRLADQLETRSDELKITPLTAPCAEVRDALFDHNSALMLLGDKEGEDSFDALNILAEALVYQANHPERDLLLYGHADTSGDEKANVELSRLRAEAVKAMLMRDADAFVRIATQRTTNETLEKYLFAFHKAFGWDCDPGIIDATFSDSTQMAIQNFQAAFNSEHEGNLRVDGIMGAKSWGAVFHLLDEQIGLLIEAKGQDKTKVRARFSPHGRGIVACGEEFPIEGKEKDGFKSQRNRRVEVAFVEQAKGGPATRRHIVLEPIVIRVDKVAVKKASLIGGDMWCEHEGGKRKARYGEVLEVVASSLGGDSVTLTAKGDEAESLEWRAPGLYAGVKKGSKVSFSIDGFRHNPAAWFFPDVLPKKWEIEALAPSGKRLKYKVWNYPNDERTIDINPIKAYRRIFDAIKKIAWVMNPEEEKRFEFFKGKVSGKTGFVEDDETNKFPRLVVFGYSIEGSFSPLISCKVFSIRFPTPIDSIPYRIRRYAGDVKAALELGGAISCSLAAFKNSNVNPKISAKASGEIEMALVLSAEVGAAKVLKVEGKGCTGFVVEVIAPLSEIKTANDWYLEIQPLWNGNTASVSFDLWDGTIAYSRKVTLVDPHKFEKITWGLGT